MGEGAPPQRPLGVRPLYEPLRRFFSVAAALVFIAGTALSFFADQTDRYFAWTIKPAMTAAFLGAGYYSAVLLELLMTRERTWPRARTSIPGLLTFVVMTLVATLLHLDRFHFDSPNGAAVLAAWGWMAIYAGVPIVMIGLVIRQLRIPGLNAPVSVPPPAGLKVVLAVQAIVLSTLGILLFAEPQRWASIWPWTLTPLTARAVAAWLIGLGVGSLQSLVEGDIDRPPMAAMYASFGALQLLALARYGSTVNWSRPEAWAYLAFVLLFTVSGGAALLVIRRARRAAAEATAPVPTS